VRLLGAQHYHEQQNVLAKLYAKYSGDLRPVVSDAQDSFDKRAFAIAGMGGQELCAAVTEVFDKYEYTDVSAAVALRELGVEKAIDDATGVATFRRAVPALHPDGLVVDDPIVGRYHVEYQDPATGTKRGLVNTRRQFEQVFVDCMTRSLSSGAR
jgi:hypothetical protein